jgi:hypothetical protein
MYLGYSSSQECKSCNRLYTDMIAKKASICYDCIVEPLVAAKVLRQGFDFEAHASGEHRGTCIVCLDENKLLGRKYLICRDCLVRRLGDLQLLSYSVRPEIRATATALTERTSAVLNIGPEWIAKSKKACDGCGSETIEFARKELLCLDCVLSEMVASTHFTLTERRTYSRSDRAEETHPGEAWSYDRTQRGDAGEPVPPSEASADSE